MESDKKWLNSDGRLCVHTTTLEKSIKEATGIYSTYKARFDIADKAFETSKRKFFNRELALK